MLVFMGCISANSYLPIHFFIYSILSEQSLPLPDMREVPGEVLVESPGPDICCWGGEGHLASLGRVGVAGEWEEEEQEQGLKIFRNISQY